MWLDISIAISCAVAGLAGGWVMRSIGFFGDNDPNMLVTLSDAHKVTDERLAEVAQGRISEVAGRLHDYATTMAMDVDAHQSRVQAVNNTLQEQEDDGSNDAVYRAVDELIAANDSMQEKLRVAQERIQEQAAQLESAEQKAHTDGLTRIANRRAFDDHMDRQFDKGHEEAGSLAILDVDHFKQFNDTYGHRAGDEVLRIVASILNARLNPYGIAARFGGEEFAIVMDSMKVEAAAEIVNHARVAIGERDIHFGDKRLRVTMSAGIAELLPSESKDDWLQRADDALYHSKEQGRDCAHWMDVSKPIRVGQSAQDDSTEESAGDDSTAEDVVSDSKESAGTASTQNAQNQSAETPTHSPNGSAGAETATDGRSAAGAAVNESREHGQQQENGKTSAEDAANKEGASESERAQNESVTKTSGRREAEDETEDDSPKSKRTADGDEDADEQPSSESKPQAEKSKDGGASTEGGRPQAFKYLPDADALAEAMTDLHQRSQTANIPLHVMAIRFDQDAEAETTDALLQIVRATLRSVDRIGCDDTSTLLVCMPNLDADSAFERGQQICHSAESISPEQSKGSSPCHVSIGLADAANDTDFFQVISRVKDAADQAKSSGERVLIADADNA